MNLLDVKKKSKYIYNIFVLIIILIIAIIILINIMQKNIFEKEGDIKYSFEELAYEEFKNETIILDAGHGYPDLGCESINGVTEADINLNIVYKIKEILEERGYKIILTRYDENSIHDENSKSISEKKISDLKNRVYMGNNSEADIFVSIHLNKISEQQYWGWQCFFQKHNSESKKLAETVQESLTNLINKHNTRKIMKLQNVYIMDNIKIPTIVVECGFLSNPSEEKLLQSNEYQEKLALGIADGIVNFLKK